MNLVAGIIVAIMFGVLVLFFFLDMLSKEKTHNKLKNENLKLTKERDAYKARYELLSEEIAKCLIDVRTIKSQMNAGMKILEEEMEFEKAF